MSCIILTFSKTTFCITTLSITTLAITINNATLSTNTYSVFMLSVVFYCYSDWRWAGIQHDVISLVILTFIIDTFCIRSLGVTLFSIITTTLSVYCCYVEWHVLYSYSECRYAECRGALSKVGPKTYLSLSSEKKNSCGFLKIKHTSLLRQQFANKVVLIAKNNKN